MVINPISAKLPKIETPPVVISLFGTFSVQVNGQPIASFRSAKARGLLAYLLLTRPQPLLRATLLDLLWLGYGAESALTSLRQALANVRSSLKPFDLLQADRYHVHLAVDPTIVWCDALHFDALLDACQHHAHRSLAGCPACQERLQQALSLYKGAFLHSLPAVDSAPFTTWLHAQQSYFAERVAALQTILASVTARGNLPHPLTTLIGRTIELKELADKALDPVYRCLTLIGPGGIGKTRLAIALGAQVQPHFTHGVWLVELSGVAPATPDEAPEQVQERLATAIGQVLNLTFYGAQPPTTQVANYLAEHTALLILDSFEHLTAGAAALLPLLTAAPRLRLLVTTRLRLPLQSQLVHSVEGLGEPPAEILDRRATPHLLTQYASLQLFVERAESAGLPLPLDKKTIALVGQICRFVEGSPWAIELAVAMLHRHRPADLLAAIQDNYRALATDLLDVPLRQRSAEAVFRTTWALLTSVEAQTLARCALFRGGFTLAAARSVAAATPDTLDALAQKSLLRQANDGRYAMHDLVRQFAEEQLALDAAAAHQTHMAHAAYFSKLLATWQPDEATEQHFRQAVTQDWENVQAAWGWAVADGQVALLQQGIRGLAEFYEIAGLYQESVQTLDAALVRVRLLLTPTQEVAPRASVELTACQTLLAHLLWRQIHVLITAFGQLAEAVVLAAELIELGRRLGDDTLTAWSYYESSMIAYYQGDYAHQSELLHQALPLAQQQGDLHQQAYCLQMIGGNLKAQNQYATAQRAFEEALTLAETVRASRLALMIGNNLGFCHYEAGNFSQAQRYFQQTLARATEIAQHDQATYATIGLGAVANTVGDYVNARNYFETGYQASAEMGNSVMATQLLGELAELVLEMGEMSLADTYCQRALGTAAAQWQKVQWELLLVQGKIQRYAGNWAAARATYEAVSTLSQQNNLPAYLLPLQAYRAAVDLAQGEVATAYAAIEPLLAHFADTPFMPSQRPQELLLIAYQILLVNADPRADGVLHQAWTLVQRQAEQISDPDLRTTFLTNVSVNRALAGLIAA